jgi:lysyl oxidase
MYHKSHDHVHFDDFALYSLQPVNAPGAAERNSAKTTFCIMDTDRVDGSLPGSPASAEYVSCGGGKQGLSIGWGDTYGNSLTGQSIDITNLPDGDYNLRIEVDPKQNIIETDETDNVSTVPLRKSGTPWFPYNELARSVI